MTRTPAKSFNKLLPVFNLALSLMMVLAFSAPFAYADEGTAAAGSSNYAAGSQGVVPDDAAPSSDTGSTSRWGKVKNFFGGIALPNGIGGVTPRVRPHLHGDSSWNSNSTLGRERSGAWQARISPGVSIDIPFGDKLFTSVGYTYGYSTTQGRRISTHSNTHNFDALARYDVSSKTVLGARNNMQWSELPGQPGNSFFLETANPEVKHQFGEHLSTGLSYIYQHYRDVTQRAVGSPATFFRSNVDNDTFDDNGVNFTSSYAFGKNLGVGPGFAWRTRDFAKTDAKDYWQIEPTIAGTYVLGPKTKLGANIGWAYRSFDVGDGYESEMTYGASVTHLMGKKFVWDLAYQKSLRDTFDTGFVFKPVSAEASSLDNYDRHYRAIKNHRVGTTATYNINEKNSIGANAIFQASYADANDNVASNDRSKEKQMEMGASYIYRLTRYVALQLGYAFGRSFEVRDNPARSQYTFHKIIAGVNVSF